MASADRDPADDQPGPSGGEPAPSVDEADLGVRFQGRRPLRHSASYLRSYGKAIWHHRIELSVLACVVLAITLAAGTAAFWFERDAGTFGSFWEAFYWAATTVTTVGYGDIVLATTAGQVVAVLASFLGAGFLLIAAGVVAVSFARAMER